MKNLNKDDEFRISAFVDKVSKLAYSNRPHMREVVSTLGIEVEKDLIASSLKYQDFSGMDLSGWNFSYADLGTHGGCRSQSAWFTDALIEEADFTNARVNINELSEAADWSEKVKAKILSTVRQRKTDDSSEENPFEFDPPEFPFDTRLKRENELQADVQTREDPVSLAKSAIARAGDGDTASMLELGSYYEHGFGVEKSVSRARTWYQHAVDKGSAEGMRALANSHTQSDHLNYLSPKEDEKKYIFDLYIKAATCGDQYSKVIVGSNREFLKDGFITFEEALSYLENAAEGGNAQAMYNLARLVEEYSQLESLSEASFNWISQSAESGYIPAMNFLSGYFSGKSDNALAFHWRKMSYEAGDKESICQLAEFHENAIGTKRDLEKAENLYREAAKLGLRLADQNLARICTGRDIQDISPLVDKEATAWSDKQAWRSDPNWIDRPFLPFDWKSLSPSNRHVLRLLRAAYAACKSQSVAINVDFAEVTGLRECRLSCYPNHSICEIQLRMQADNHDSEYILTLLASPHGAIILQGFREEGGVLRDFLSIKSDLDAQQFIQLYQSFQIRHAGRMFFPASVDHLTIKTDKRFDLVSKFFDQNMIFEVLSGNITSRRWARYRMITLRGSCLGWLNIKLQSSGKMHEEGFDCVFPRLDTKIRRFEKALRTGPELSYSEVKNKYM